MFYRSKEMLKKLKIKIVEYIFLVARNGSGFDSYLVLNNLSQWQSVVNLIKNRAGIVSLKIFNWYIEKKKEISEYAHFRWGRVNNNSSLKK